MNEWPMLESGKGGNYILIEQGMYWKGVVRGLCALWSETRIREIRGAGHSQKQQSEKSLISARRFIFWVFSSVMLSTVRGGELSINARLVQPSRIQLSYSVSHPRAILLFSARSWPQELTMTWQLIVTVLNIGSGCHLGLSVWSLASTPPHSTIRYRAIQDSANALSKTLSGLTTNTLPQSMSAVSFRGTVFPALVGQFFVWCVQLPPPALESSTNCWVKGKRRSYVRAEITPCWAAWVLWRTWHRWAVSYLLGRTFMIHLFNIKGKPKILHLVLERKSNLRGEFPTKQRNGAAQSGISVPRFNAYCIAYF